MILEDALGGLSSGPFSTGASDDAAALAFFVPCPLRKLGMGEPPPDEPPPPLLLPPPLPPRPLPPPPRPLPGRLRLRLRHGRCRGRFHSQRCDEFEVRRQIAGHAQIFSMRS